MTCNQALSGIAQDCTPSMGGIVEVYINNYSEVSAVTTKDNQVTGITISTNKFKRFSFARQTGSMTSTYTIDRTTGANYVATDLVLQFNRMETSKRVEISALAVNELAVMVKDCNGKYWYLGKDEPVVATAGDGQSGTARGDRNGYSITLQDNAAEMPFEILVGDGGVTLSEIVEE